MPRKGQNPSQGRRAGSTPTAHRVQVTYLIISAAGTAPEVTNGDQVETDATVAEDRHGDSIRIEALPDAEIHNPNLTRLVLKGGDMYTGTAAGDEEEPTESTPGASRLSVAFFQL